MCKQAEDLINLLLDLQYKIQILQRQEFNSNKST